jgi:hypothetical protein
VLGGRSKAESILKEMCGISGTVSYKEGPKQERSLLAVILDWLGMKLPGGAGGSGGWIVRY